MMVMASNGHLSQQQQRLSKRDEGKGDGKTSSLSRADTATDAEIFRDERDLVLGPDLDTELPHLYDRT
jgi:hypothetical protein